MTKKNLAVFVVLLITLVVFSTIVLAAEDSQFYSGQIASFKSRSEADDLVKTMSVRGHDAFSHQVEVKGGTWYRVMIGKYDSRAEAVKRLEALKKDKVIGEFFIQRMKGNAPEKLKTKEPSAVRKETVEQAPVPMVKSAEAKVPEVTAPAVTTPSEKTSEITVPAATDPEVNAPPVTVPTMTNQEAKTPDAMVPEATPIQSKTIEKEAPAATPAQPETIKKVAPEEKIKVPVPVEAKKETREDYSTFAPREYRSADYYYILGIAHDEKGRYDQAIENYTKAVEKDPNYAAAYNKRGIIYIKRGQSELALADHEKAISLNPRNAEYYLNRGIDHRLAGHFDLAMSDFQAACKMGSEQACDALRRIAEKVPKTR